MGKRIELLSFRKRHNLTQKEMAAKLAITATHYSRIETGSSNPSYEILERFKEVFGITEVFEIFEKYQ